MHRFHRKRPSHRQNDPRIRLDGSSLKAQDALASADVNQTGQLMMGQPRGEPSPLQSGTVEANAHPLKLPTDGADLTNFSVLPDTLTRPQGHARPSRRVDPATAYLQHTHAALKHICVTAGAIGAWVPHGSAISSSSSTTV